MTDTDLEALASSLLKPSTTGTASYKHAHAKLLKGLTAEKIRLGAGPWVVVLQQDVFDVDGLVTFWYLHNAFSEATHAVAYANAAARTLVARYCAIEPWRLESEREVPWIAKPARAVGVRCLHTRTYSLKGIPCYSTYCHWRVIGPFQKSVISEELFDFFINDRPDLRSYFFRVAESIDTGKTRPECVDPY